MIEVCLAGTVYLVLPSLPPPPHVHLFLYFRIFISSFFSAFSLFFDLYYERPNLTFDTARHAGVSIDSTFRPFIIRYARTYKYK